MDLVNIRKNLQNKQVYGMPLEKFLGLLANVLIIPILTIQMINVYTRGKASDYSIIFLLFRLFSTPRGAGGVVTGIVKNNPPIIIIGAYSVFYYLFILYFYLFPRKSI